MIEDHPYGYKFISKDELTWEDYVIDTLNFLGAIPIIGSISGIARMIFADIKLRSIKQEYSDSPNKDALLKHYNAHFNRGTYEAAGIFTLGLMNLYFCSMDIYYSINALHDKNIRSVHPKEYISERHL